VGLPEGLTVSPVQQEIGGFVEAGFEPVRDAFARNFETLGDRGAGVSVFVGGCEVVSLFGGDARPGEPWKADTLACIYSVSKGVAAFVAQVLTDRGLLDLDAPLERYWPEYATNGKEATTLRMILTHTAGVPWFPEYWTTVSFDDGAGWHRLDEIATRLAAAPPQWEPGTKLGYHSVTYGWLIGELVRRVDGRSFGEFLREEVAMPLDLDLHVGLPESEHARVAPFTPNAILEPVAPAPYTEPGGKALFIGPAGRTLCERGADPVFWTAEAPAVNGMSTAHGVARLYALLAAGGELDGVRLVSAESVTTFAAEQRRELNVLRGVEVRTALGYARPNADWMAFGPNDEAFGFKGAGGAVGFADPTAGVGFGYVTASFGSGGGALDPRPQAICDALYACLPPTGP
jgi:CubicO group peptidase (beta-lactamase class C family)